MIYRINSSLLSDSRRERPRGQEGDFPFSAIESDLSKFPDRTSDWHWHEHLEFCCVSAGRVMCATQRRNFVVGEGEGCFINTDVLHMHRLGEGAEQGVLHVIQFDASLIASCGRVARRYVQPVIKCAAADAIHLKRDDSVAARALDAVRAAFEAAEHEPEGWELAAVFRLQEAWRSVYGLIEPLFGEQADVARGDAARTKRMLAYIHDHYGEPISVDDIAAAAGISAREAYRCFKQVLSVTPTAYLTRQRLDAASRMLAETDAPVTEIALDCGFSSPGYFCKVFRAATGRSPREYRRTGKTDASGAKNGARY